MCGIAGFSGRPVEGREEQFVAFMEALALETQSRGHHATGIAAWTGGSRSIIGKGPVDATNFIKTPVWKKGLEAKSMVVHCRYATHGSPGKNENNHPFEQGRYAMIHNGVIGDFREIAKSEKVALTSECDSEVILRVFAKGAGKDHDAQRGLQRWVDAAGPGAYSRYAVAILDRSNGDIRLLRNEGSPCSILRIPSLGVVFFASTKEILARAFDAMYKRFPDETLTANTEQWECIPHRIYVLHPDSTEVDHEEIKVPEIDYKPTSYGQQPLGFSSGTKSYKTASTTGIWDGNRGGTMFVCELCGQPDCECGRPRGYNE